MIGADAFLDPARARGFGFYAGVPCSFLTPIINRVISDPALEYVGATSEGEAVAIAAGAWLAGRKTVVMCQNSGLGNAVNPLTSLSFPFRIPTLLVVTWRGQPGIHDEPQHELMGRITGSLLDAMRIPHQAFPDTPEDVEPALARAEAEMNRSELPFGLVMAKDTVRDDGLDQKPPDPRPAGARRDLREHGPRPTRVEALRRFLAVVPDAAGVIATTGKCGRELFTLADRPQHLYQVGSMGGASAMGLGVALHTPRPVVVLDGDGAALMKLGNLATIGSRAPANLCHVVLDNGVHDSTGGQATVSASVDFAAVALACGYASGTSCDSLGGLEEALGASRDAPGPHLIHARIAPGSLAKLGRPTITPPEVARRFRAFLAER
ncbi:MAG TPA: phosphonopyruvate decarboxylase [Methylomirabilota bacterium]